MSIEIYQLLTDSNNDNIKNKYCFDNNIKIIRIPYWDYSKIENILNNYI
jgi:hypothetical protein